MPTPTLTPEAVAAHERLYPRLAALMKQVERVASRRPGAPVPEESAKLSRELCREAARLLGRDGRGIGLPKPVAGAAPLDHAGLAIHLGQAVAGLEAFEAAHSAVVAGVPSWQLGTGESRPVARLWARAASTGQRQAAPKPQAARSRYDETPAQMRSAVIKRIMERENQRYMQGYRDAKAGKPAIRPITEMEPVPHGGNHVPDRRGGEGYPPLPPED